MNDFKWNAPFPGDPRANSLKLPFAFTLLEWPVSHLSLYLGRIFTEKAPKAHFLNDCQGVLRCGPGPCLFKDHFRWFYQGDPGPCWRHITWKIFQIVFVCVWQKKKKNQVKSKQFLHSNSITANWQSR